MTPRKKKETAPDTAAKAADVAAAALPDAVEGDEQVTEAAAAAPTPEVEMPEAADADVAPSDSILTYAPEQLADDMAGSSVVDQMIAFHLSGQRYGLPIDSVQEIQQIVTFSQQNGSGAVVGMVNLRGEVIPAIDMRALLGLEHLEYNVNTPMIICRSHQGLVALVVDEVEDVITLPVDCIAVPPKLHNLSDRMIGVCRLGTDLVYLLDVERLVSPLGLSSGGGW